jgi:hypothetical protein
MDCETYCLRRLTWDSWTLAQIDTSSSHTKRLHTLLGPLYTDIYARLIIRPPTNRYLTYSHLSSFSDLIVVHADIPRLHFPYSPPSQPIVPLMPCSHPSTFKKCTSRPLPAYVLTPPLTPSTASCEIPLATSPSSPTTR